MIYKIYSTKYVDSMSAYKVLLLNKYIYFYKIIKLSITSIIYLQLSIS